MPTLPHHHSTVAAAAAAVASIISPQAFHLEIPVASSGFSLHRLHFLCKQNPFWIRSNGTYPQGLFGTETKE
ncbi:hypothetical protein Droror1_Dr00016117 [Drosera rotundifolia]